MQRRGFNMHVTLTSKQAEYVREAHHRWNFAVGAVRSGKSHLATLHTIPDRLLTLHGRRGLNMIIGATKENIERNVLSPMRDIYGQSLVGDINQKNWATLFGEKVYCLGGENIRQVNRLRGSEIKFCYCDEICDIHPDVFEMLKSRLSLPYSECHAACNPASPTHPIKLFIDKAQVEDIDLFYQHYTIYDNPFLPESYVRGLEAEYRGTVYFQRYILGLWSKAEGLVYPMYEDAREDTWEPDDEDRDEGYCVSVDYGTQNAFAALKWRRGSSSGWHCVGEYRYSGRDEGHQKTDADYVADMVAFASDVPEGREVEVIVDPSASSFIAALRRCPDRKFRVRHADNDVENGIRDTAVSIQLGLVHISDSCVETYKEFQGYVWDDKSDHDRPIKVDDHMMDAMRYFVRTKRVYRPRREYESVMERMQGSVGPRRINV